jgi:hypothetical protein
VGCRWRRSGTKREGAGTGGLGRRAAFDHGRRKACPVRHSRHLWGAPYHCGQSAPFQTRPATCRNARPTTYCAAVLQASLTPPDVSSFGALRGLANYVQESIGLTRQTLGTLSQEALIVLKGECSAMGWDQLLLEPLVRNPILVEVGHRILTADNTSRHRDIHPGLGATRPCSRASCTGLRWQRTMTLTLGV